MYVRRIIDISLHKSLDIDCEIGMFYWLLSVRYLSILLLVSDLPFVLTGASCSRVGLAALREVFHAGVLQPAEPVVRGHAAGTARFIGDGEGRTVIYVAQLGDRASVIHLSKEENQSQTEDVILLGQPEDAPYVVVIPGGEERLLNRIQNRFPQAFFTDSPLGRYVQAGAFSTYAEAEAVNEELILEGFNSRVVYLRVR